MMVLAPASFAPCTTLSPTPPQPTTSTVEPDAWEDAGGSAASVRYYQGVLMVRAPDYIHRQIGGYPFAARPAGAQFSDSGTGGRYVMFTGALSDVQLKGVATAKIRGTAGGSGGATTAGATAGPAPAKSDANAKPKDGDAKSSTTTPPEDPKSGSSSTNKP